MEKTLRTDVIKEAMDRAGLSQTALAKKLGITREAVSKWLSGNKFPRPDKLLKLGVTLGLEFDDLVNVPVDINEPVIAFRKKVSAKTTEKHIKRAKEIGHMLEPLVTYLPYDRYEQPPALKDPRRDYDYLQGVSRKTRREIGLKEDGVIDFSHLIKKFNELQAVIVPVMWGKKGGHENAIHIYLPQSMTTWVYLNLDTEAHDFKFWMAHELGHVYSPDLRDNAAEDFADAFAGALLFPEILAEQTYNDLVSIKNHKNRLEIIRQRAEYYSISMPNVLYEVNNFAGAHKKEKIDLGADLYKVNAGLNKSCKTVKERLFPDSLPTASDYIETSKQIFDTPFFEALKSYLTEHRKSPGYIQCILDTPLLDAKELHAELS